MAENEQRAGGKVNIVAIGASAGGLRALTTVISEFPTDFPVPTLVVQHLDPRHPSHLADILDRHAVIRVVEATDGQEVEAGVAYVAPPGRHMLLERSRIRLTTTQLVHFVRPSVDLLFESVAAAYGADALAVILTGSGSDGALGIRAIKEKGGLTIVQDPQDAESSGMPHAAIATGFVDSVLPLARIGREIVEAVIHRE